MEKSITQIATE